MNKEADTTSGPAKVLIVYGAHENSTTGGPQMMARLLRRIDRSRFSPFLLAQSEDPLVTQLSEEDGLETIILPLGGVLNQFGKKLLAASPIKLLWRAAHYLMYLPRAARCVWKVKPRLVWCQNLRALLTVGPGARVSRLPVVWQIGLGLQSKGRVSRLVNDFALSLTTAVFIESQAQIESLFTERQRSTHQHKFMIISKGIDLERFDPDSCGEAARRPTGIPDDAFVIGTVGALTPRKGLDYLLEAAAAVRKDEERVHLVVIGEDPSSEKEYRQGLEEKSGELGTADCVHFVGFQDDVERWLAGFDLFVLASHGEGISGALREAMAMRLPVIATDVGGTPDLIQNNVNGLIVPPGDAAALAGSIRSVLDDPEQREKLGAQARKTIEEKFSLEGHVNGYQDAFDVLVSPEHQNGLKNMPYAKSEDSNLELTGELEN